MGIVRTVLLWLVSLATFSSTSVARAETWKIITLDWPPYTDQKLPDSGAAAKALRVAMKTVGIDIQFVFMPWSRGMYELQKAEYVGIFPSWRRNPKTDTKLSPSLFKSPIVFAFPKSKVRSWKTLQDFKGLRIGTVQDYDYPEEFIDLGKNHFFKLYEVTADEQNLFKVAYKRLDATIVDKVNAEYLIRIRNPDLAPLITIDPRVYRNADLYISLKADEHFEERFAKIKLALSHVNSQKIVDEAVKAIQH
jgi:polar amino acid transport system substrate-binding protein